MLKLTNFMPRSSSVAVCQSNKVKGLWLYANPIHFQFDNVLSIVSELVAVCQSSQVTGQWLYARSTLYKLC